MVAKNKAELEKSYDLSKIRKRGKQDPGHYQPAQRKAQKGVKR